MKTCNKCKIEKELDAFANNRAKPDGKNPMCRECKKAYNAVYYTLTKDKHNPGRRVRKAQYVKIAQDYVNRIKLETPCTDCGVNYLPIVMQFDHLPEFEKKANIADLVGMGSSISRIQEEIAKCEVVCSNCHAIRGWVRRGSKPYDFDMFVIYKN
jgi:hypothetical protein